MTDIVERLREEHDSWLLGDEVVADSIYSAAADEIERLRERNAFLEADPALVLLRRALDKAAGKATR